jgi:hypothetical protein
MQMRAITVLVALVAMPLVASLAQGRDNSKWSTGLRKGWNGGSLPPGLAKKDPPPPPQPPPPQPPPPPPASCGLVNASAGTGVISGSVLEGRTGLFGGLGGWCVHVSLNGTDVASVATDAAGNFSVSGLADGMYLVCQDVQSGWTETTPGGFGYPLCPSGLAGYTVNVVAGGGGSVFFINS